MHALLCAEYEQFTAALSASQPPAVAAASDVFANSGIARHYSITRSARARNIGFKRVDTSHAIFLSFWTDLRGLAWSTPSP